MPEEEWLECTDPQRMQEFLDTKVTDRKIQLFVVACCRRLWHLMTDDRSKLAVNTAEAFIHGNADRQDLDRARDEAHAAEREAGEFEVRSAFPAGEDAAEAAHACSWAAGAINSPSLWINAVHTHLAAAGACAWPALGYEERFANEQTTIWSILRHLIGNPFKPYPVPPSWPSSVVQLASAMYEGQNCSFALHDALLEAGHMELAEHFKVEEWHPKGCWVLDVILGKK